MGRGQWRALSPCTAQEQEPENKAKAVLQNSLFVKTSSKTYPDRHFNRFDDRLVDDWDRLFEELWLEDVHWMKRVLGEVNAVVHVLLFQCHAHVHVHGAHACHASMAATEAEEAVSWLSKPTGHQNTGPVDQWQRMD